MKSFLTLILILQVTVASAQNTGASQPVNVKDFGAKGDAKSDDTAAITEALNTVKLLPKPAVLFFPEGTYRYSQNLVVDSIALRGAGMGRTILEATNIRAISWKMMGRAPEISDLSIRSAQPSTSRDTRPEGCGIQVSRADNFLIARVEIGPVAGAGIVVRQSGGDSVQPAKIIDCIVKQTKADGIHLTRGSHDIVVDNNDVTGTGDDFIAVVSYRSDRELCHDIRITNNRVGTQSQGRGITVVGGNNVTIDGNRIGPSSGAGIYITSEASYKTLGVANITVTNNTIDHAVTKASLGHGAIHLAGRINPESATEPYEVKNIVLQNNHITTTGRSGIYVGPYTNHVTVTGNELSGVAATGIAIGPNTTDIELGSGANGQQPNLIRSCGDYGVQVDPSGGKGTLRINGIHFGAINGRKQAHVDAINIGKGGTFAATYVNDNRVEKTGSRIERVIESQTRVTEALRNTADGPVNNSIVH